MVINKSKQIRYGAILSYLHIATGALITLFYTPFMIQTLGKSEYGLYNTVASVVSSLSVLSLGFGSSYVRFYYKYNSEDEEKRTDYLNGMYMIIFLFFGAVILICGLYLSFHLEYVFDRGLTEAELAKAKILMVLLVFSLAASFPLSVFNSIITANECFIFQKTIVLVKQLASPLICIPLLLKGYASIAMVLSSLIVNVVADFINVYFCIYKLECRFLFNKFDIRLFWEIARYSGLIAVNMVVNMINYNIDKILLGRYKGTASVAVYSAGYTLYNYYLLFSTSISNVFTPRIHKTWNSKNKTVSSKNEELTYLFTHVGEIQFVILLLICSGFYIFGRQFISIWAGDGYGNAYYVMLLLAVPATIPLSQNIGIEIQRAQNKHHFRAFFYLGMALINLILSIYLCQLYGEIGSAVGTAISLVVANIIGMNIYYHFCLGINVIKYWQNSLMFVLVAIPAFIIGYIICIIFDTYTVKFMLIGILIYSICYVTCFLCFPATRKKAFLLIGNMRRK